MKTNLWDSGWINKYSILTLFYTLFTMLLFGLSTALAASTEINTLKASNDDIVDVAVEAGTFEVKADIAASNGVIHVIDTVLLP